MVNWQLGNLFLEDFGIQGSIKTLWQTRWRFPCSKGLYPFHDGKLEDFEEIFENLIAENINDPYDDAWALSFIPKAVELSKKACEVTSQDKELAIQLYKRACAVYRIARFPYVGTPLKRNVYAAQKAAYLQGARLWDVPMKELMIPFTDAAEGDEKEIPLYIRDPPNVSEGNPCPVMLLITGLDGHRPDNSERSDEAVKRGWASVICDIPGVADCPALKTDPLSPDRLFTTILSWIASQPHYNANKVVAWGLSAGGYYAIRLAHTHASQLCGAVGHGAGTHHYIGREWLEHVDHHEYPFDLSRAYCMKYGYDSWEQLMEGCQRKFSLLENGILEKKSCRLLLMNGVLDGCMPIEDSMLLFEHGPMPKEARFIPGRAHMGYPEANSFVWPWMAQVVAAGGPNNAAE